jgi:hypothetical protein
MKILQGPRTDPVLLVSAIKNTAMASTTISHTVLYDRGGAEIELVIKCSPYMSGDEPSTNCLMELSRISAIN